MKIETRAGNVAYFNLQKLMDSIRASFDASKVSAKHYERITSLSKHICEVLQDEPHRLYSAEYVIIAVTQQLSRRNDMSASIAYAEYKNINVADIPELAQYCDDYKRMQ